MLSLYHVRPLLMKRLLLLKHWQMFALMWGPGLLTLPLSPEASLEVFPVSLLLFGGVHLAWWYAIGAEMERRLPDHLRSSPTLFRVHAVYLMVVIAAIGSLLRFRDVWIHNATLQAVFLLMVLYYFPAFIIVVRFSARALATVEKQAKADAGDYMGNFMLLWMSFIGVWVLQPKLNRIAAHE